VVGVREDRLGALRVRGEEASGYFAFSRTISRSENCSWTMQVPGHRVIGRPSVREKGVCGGPARRGFPGRAGSTDDLPAFDEVTMMSDTPSRRPSS
jgi:hypothetical protein